MSYFVIPVDKKCILCGTNNEGDALLIPDITTKEGNICEAKLIHVDCLQKELFIQDDLIVGRIK